MRQMLMVFAWLGVAGGSISAIAVLAIGQGGWAYLAALGYILAALFWFALCAVLAETHAAVERLSRRVGDMQRDLHKVRKTLPPA